MNDNIKTNNWLDLQEEGFTLFKKVWDKDKYNFYEYLSVMLDSWVSLSKTLSWVWEKLDNLYFKQKINELEVFVSSWDSLSMAMKKLPQIFSSHEISIIEAWESTWTLNESLENLANFIKKRDILKKKIKSSLTYPFIIFVFLILAIVIVLTYVIPALMPLFENSDAKLPFATRALIATSNFIQNYWLILLFFIFAFIVFILIYASSESWRAKLDNILLSLPLIWPVYRNYVISNISLIMWNLIWAWIWMVKVLSLTWKASWSFVYEKLFEEIKQKVELWNKIVDSMQEVDEDKFYFPNSYLQMLSVWEKTANMQKINNKISDQYLREVDYSLATLTKYIEPIAIVIAAVFVLWFAFAVFGAILQVTQSIW